MNFLRKLNTIIVLILALVVWPASQGMITTTKQTNTCPSLQNLAFRELSKRENKSITLLLKEEPLKDIPFAPNNVKEIIQFNLDAQFSDLKENCNTVKSWYNNDRNHKDLSNYYEKKDYSSFLIEMINTRNDLTTCIREEKLLNAYDEWLDTYLPDLKTVGANVDLGLFKTTYSPKMTSLLLKHKTDVNVKSKKEKYFYNYRPTLSIGSTPLHYCVCERLDCVEILLNNNANINAQDNNGNTPLHHVIHHHWERFWSFTTNPKYNIKRHLDEYKSYGTIGGFGTESVDIVLYILLRYNADPNIKNLKGDAPLHFMIKGNNGAYDTGFPNDRMVAMLLEKKADVNSIDIDLRTPLHLAIINYHTKNDHMIDTRNSFLTIIKDLLAHGADITMQDKYHKTALDYAIENNNNNNNNNNNEYTEGYNKVIKLL